MIFNYLKLSFRLLIRNPFLTFINVLGLSIGFAVFFILWQYSQNELKSDQFHKDWKKIVRFGLLIRWKDDKVNWEESYCATNNAALAEKISKAYPQVKEFTRIHFQENFKLASHVHKKHEGEIFFTYTDRNDKRTSFLEEHVAYADPNLFAFFSIPLIRGNVSQVLQKPGSIVLSEKIAQKYFGHADPIGKTMVLNDSTNLEVTGVFKDLPQNTHLDFEILISTQTTFPSLEVNDLLFFHCYFKLKEGVDVNVLGNRINTDFQKEYTKVFFGNWQYGEVKFYLQSIAEMVFQSKRGDNYQTKSSFVLTIFKYSAIVILLLAWINYVNLSVSANKVRMKEMAARKSVGATTSSFASQFIVESTVTNIISILIALTLIQLCKQPMALIFHFYLLPWSELPLSGYMILGLVCLGGIVVTGLYPCWVTMRNSPKNLFGALKTRGNAGSMHASLPIFQYCAAIVMLLLVAVVYSQVNFVLSKNIGLNRDHVIVFDLPIVTSNTTESNLSYLQNRIMRLPQVSGATISQSVPNDNTEAFLGMVRTLNDAGVRLQSNGGVDENFVPFYGIELITGRNFNGDSPSDSSSIILSEGAIKRLGFKNPAEAVGSNVFLDNRAKKPLVIGVIADYKLRPYLNFEDNANYGGNPGVALVYKNYLDKNLKVRKVSVRTTTDDFKTTLSEIKNIYAIVFPGAIFNWYFLDDIIAKQYQTYNQARSQIALFTVIALIIAGLGLLGMISNKVVEKTKEIGIRRVLGAQMHKIALVLVSGTIKQVIIATAIGIPVGYYIALQYLERFSERITLQWWHYTAPVLILVAIMTVVISFILWKTAMTNPVDALRYE